MGPAALAVRRARNGVEEQTTDEDHRLECGHARAVQVLERHEGGALRTQRDMLSGKPERVALLAEMLERMKACTGLRDDQRDQDQQNDRLFPVAEQGLKPQSSTGC